MLKHVTRFAAAAIAVAGFSTAAAAQDKVTIGVPNWPSVNITANVIKVIAEENFGTEVELVLLSYFINGTMVPSPST